MGTQFEDKAFGGNKPYIDLIPERLWDIKVRISNHIGQAAWQLIQKHVATRVDKTCELCGASHEKQGAMGKRAHNFKIELRFEHDHASRIATLRRLLYVCAQCSNAIHFRQTEMRGTSAAAGYGPRVESVARLARFHNMSEVDIERWLDAEIRTGAERSRADYPDHIDVDIIEDGLNRLWHK